MKISIWQQFSSNHSANYTVVGIFSTAEQASKMAEDLQDLVLRIYVWRERNRAKLRELSPPEIEAEKTYDIEWEEPIDWLGYGKFGLRYPYARTPQENIFVQDNIVFINPPDDDTWQTGHQFAKIMQKNGAEIFRDIYMGYYNEMIRNADIQFNLSIYASDQQKATTIYSALRGYIDEKYDEKTQSPYYRSRRFEPMPWAIYHNRAWKTKTKLTPENYAHEEAIWIREEKRLIDHRHRYNSNLNKNAIKVERIPEYVPIEKQSKDIGLHIALFRHISKFQSKALTLQDMVIRIEDAYPIYALASLIGWCRAMECKTEYTLMQDSDETHS